MEYGPEFGDTPESLSDADLLAFIEQLRKKATDLYCQGDYAGMEAWSRTTAHFATEARHRGIV